MDDRHAEGPPFDAGAGLAAGDPRAEAAWFRVAFAASPTAMALLDLAGRLREANPAAQRFLGYSAAELRGRSLAHWTHPDDVAEGRRLFRELATGARDRCEREKRYLRQDGRVVWSRAIALRLPGPAGDAARVLGMVEDQTARREAAAGQPQLEALFRAVIMAGQHGLALVEARGGEEVEGAGGAAGPPSGGGLVALTRRQHEVLVLLDEGLSAVEIGARLGIRTRTVEDHTRLLYEKLDAHSRLAAVHAARRWGLL